MADVESQNRSENPFSERPGRIVFYVMNPKAGFSGGRYHAWMVAEAAAESGWDVSIITTNVPPFEKDFDVESLFPAHNKMKIHLCKLMEKEPCKLPDIECDVLVVVPHGDSKGAYYHNAIDFAASRGAKIALLNFESPNWFNSLSPVQRDPAKWNGWKLVSESAAMVFSLSGEGSAWAKEFYNTAPSCTTFEHLWPGVNSRVADLVGEIPTEKRVLVLTRFAHAEHKGGNLVPELFCEAMRGYTAVFMVGIGKPDPAYTRVINKSAAKYDIAVELLGTISEEDKWREFKRASLILFPSSFEGYGLPPTEAQYAGTPCIAFDLPVLREVSGDGIIYVRLGDTVAMREKIAEVLGSDTDWSYLTEKFGAAGRFEDFGKRVDRLFSRVRYEGTSASDIAAEHVNRAALNALSASDASLGLGFKERADFPMNRHAVYLRKNTSQLVERWLRRLPSDAKVLLLVEPDSGEIAQDFLKRFPQIYAVVTVSESIEDGVPSDKVSTRVSAQEDFDAVMLPLPLETEPVEFLPDNNLPKLGPHYNLFRALWQCGFRKFAVQSHAGVKCINLPWLLDAFVDRHKGQRCFVVGNGPSLNDIDMSLLKNEITMGSNRCYLGYEKWGFDFTYWGLLDRLQVEQYGPEYEVNIPDATPKFFPFDYAGLLEFNNACPINQNWDYMPPYGFSGTPDEIRLGFTVTHMMIQIAVNMGCNPIYIIGCDHRYNLSTDKESARRIGTKNAKIWTAQDATKPTHFTENYTGGAEKLFVAPNPERMDQGFDAAQEWCLANGVQVLNATPNTGLKSFPLVDYDTLFEPDAIRQTPASSSVQLTKLKDLPSWANYPRDASGQMLQRIQCAELGAALTENDGKIAALKNIHEGKIGWLLGNGPSVRTEDLDRLEERPSFGCNRLYLAYDKMKFRPTYLCSTDEQMIRDFGHEMQAQHPGKVLFTANDPPEMNGNAVWFQMGSRTPLIFSNNVYDYVMPGGGTLITALQIGFHMGITRFIIYGMDHSFTFEKDDSANHFESATGDKNHFIKDYRDGKPWAPPVPWQVEGALLSAHVFLQQHGGWIKNATHGGKLEVLQRVGFDEALEIPD